MAVSSKTKAYHPQKATATSRASASIR